MSGSTLYSIDAWFVLGYLFSGALTLLSELWAVPKAIQSGQGMVTTPLPQFTKLREDR